MGAAAHNTPGAPLGEINTTPLIDVLLVLLIMFIITIPIQTHAVKVDLPSAGRTDVNRDKNKIVVDKNGTILWNGAAVDRLRLRQYLEIVGGMKPAPEVHLQPHPQARYEIVDEVLAITKRANITTMGFVGNEAYASF
jgi:biopolymer transport protein ExbD